MSETPRPADEDRQLSGPVGNTFLAGSEPERPDTGVAIGAGDPNTFEPEEVPPGDDATPE